MLMEKLDRARIECSYGLAFVSWAVFAFTAGNGASLQPSFIARTASISAKISGQKSIGQVSHMIASWKSQGRSFLSLCLLRWR